MYVLLILATLDDVTTHMWMERQMLNFYWKKITLNAVTIQRCLSLLLFSHVCFKIRILVVHIFGAKMNIDWLILIETDMNADSNALQCNVWTCHAYRCILNRMHWLLISGRIEMQLFNSFGLHCTFATSIKLHCSIRNKCCTPGGQFII